MKPKHPIEIAVFVLLLVAFNCWIAPASSALFPAGLRRGELWRLFTYPWPHISLYHLLLDAAALRGYYLLLATAGAESEADLCMNLARTGRVDGLLLLASAY